MGAVRFVCLGLPFALTFGSLICLIIVITGLHPNKEYYFAKFDTANLSVSTTVLTKRDFNGLEARDQGIAHLHTEALAGVSTSSSSVTVNVTASELGLADSYTVGLWNYCSQTKSTNGSSTKQVCSKAKAEFAFDPFAIWNLSDTTAESAINSTTLKDAMKTYKTASKWTFVAYIIALIFTVLEILFGVVAIFSKIGSCVTSIISSVGSVALTIASILATVMWSIVVASFNHELKKYGLHASVSTKMLAVTWLAVAFSIASGFFWSLSVCCCGSTDRGYSRPSRQNRVNNDAEKLVPTNAYQPVHDPAFVSSPYAGQPTVYNPPTQQGFGEQHQMSGTTAKPTRNLDTAYEPYRHENI